MNLQSIYSYYFTSANAKVFFSHKETGKIVNADLLTGIGYDYNTSSVPVYTLGSSKPAFFSKGNFLGQGMFVVSFKDEQYLKAMLQYTFGETKTTANPRESTFSKQMSDEAFKAKSKLSLSATTSTNINIGDILSLFDIKIFLNNSTPDHVSTPKTIILRDCKITGESLELSSSQDRVLQQGYKFYFKDILREQYE